MTGALVAARGIRRCAGACRPRSLHNQPRPMPPPRAARCPHPVCPASVKESTVGKPPRGRRRPDAKRRPVTGASAALGL